MLQSGNKNSGKHTYSGRRMELKNLLKLIPYLAIIRNATCYEDFILSFEADYNL